MKKIIFRVLVAALIAGGLVMCGEEEVLPTGDLVAQGGKPGGTTLGGGGGTDTFPSFDINNMPAPKFWNDQGGYEKLPDLFTFANGSKVTTADDWFGTAANGYKGRRWEIEQIVQHYEYGYMPPYTQADGLTVIYTQTNETTINIQLAYSKGSINKTANFNVTASFPSGAMPEGGYPAIMECGSGGATSFSTARDGRYAMIGFNVDDAAAESNHAGVVDTLFGYDYTNDLNAPSIFMAYAWTAGRIIDAIEQGAWSNKINAKKLIVTGMSRWGKGAEICAAFAKSQNGTQIAVCDIGSAGCGGPAMERFISTLGLQDKHLRYVTETYDNIPGRVYYFKFIGSTGYDYMKTVAHNTSEDWFATNHDDTSQPKYTGPIKTSDDLPTAVKAITKAEYDTLGVNDKFTYESWPYEGIYNGNYWRGLENLAQLIHGSPTWFSARFKQFKDTHYGLLLDNVGGLPLRAPDGYLTTIPFDQHFLMALIAPRAVIIHDGFRTVRNNPEGQFLNHLATDEVYKFLEEQGVRPEFAETEKLSDFNAIKFYHITHAQPEYEMIDTINLADVFFGYKASSAIDNWERLRDPPFPIDDSRSKYDYSKLNWARPGGTPLSQQVASVPDYDWAKTTMWD